MSSLATPRSDTTGDSVPNIKSLLKLKKKYDAPEDPALPESYRKNSEKELLWLWCANNLVRQLKFDFPHLRPLCLTPCNECGVKKLICTFVKPTVVSYSHLYDVDECSKFIADFIYYSPERVFDGKMNSPTRVINEQTGNSFEMSVLLVSLLRGFGWDAYVVVGWVDKRTATMDQSNQSCPLMAEVHQEEEVADKKEDNLIYRLRRPERLVSKYQEFLASKSESEDHGEEDRDEDVETSKTEIFHGWVYIETENLSFFIEPTTGMRHSISSASYIRINCLFNDQNYWLNLKEGSLSRKGKKLELDNKSKWLRLVQDITKTKKPKEKKINEIGIGLLKVKKEELSDPEDEPEVVPKRPFDVLYSWVKDLDIPKDSYELMYRLGQKTEKYYKTKVEYYAPYLLKDGMVQRMIQYDTNSEEAEELKSFVKYRNRADKLSAKVIEKQENRLTEKFDMGRPDRLEELVYINYLASNCTGEQVKVYTFYHKSRKDGLSSRESRDWEINDTYLGREDCLVSLHVNFGIPDKKFGPAEDEERSARKILTITERFSLPVGEDPKTSIAERVFDLDEESIKLKFHREKDRILSQVVSFSRPGEGHKTVYEEDVSVYVVDPRETEPDLRELQVMYKEQVKLQLEALNRVKRMERELAEISELRMKEESATELSVGLFDTKRNVRVQRGRETQERERREREKSEVDLELDFLAPFLVKYDASQMTRQKALQVRDECLESIKASMDEKEYELTSQLQKLKNELETLKTNLPLVEKDINSKKFFANVLETRIKRLKAYSKNQYLTAEKKIRQDPRLTKYLV